MMRYADQIKKINKCLNWNKYGYCRKGNGEIDFTPEADLSSLEALCLFNEKIKTINNSQLILRKNPIRYDYRDPITMKTFLNTFKNQKKILVLYILCVMPIMTMWLSRYIEYNYCQKILTADDRRFNEIAIAFNEGLDRFSEQWTKLKNQLELVAPEQYIKVKQPMKLIDSYYSWTDYFKMVVPQFMTSLYILLLPEKKMGIYVPILSSIGYMISYVVLLPILWDRIFSLTIFKVLGGISTFFFGLACIKSIIDVRSAKRAIVHLEGISDVIRECNDGKIIICG